MKYPAIAARFSRRQLTVTTILISIILASALASEIWQDSLMAGLGASLDWLHSEREHHPVLFAGGYAALYMASLALLLPTDSLMMIIAGLSYQPVTAILFACTIHTAGATVSYAGTRRLTGYPGKPLSRRDRLKAWWSLLALRLVPFLPTHIATVTLAQVPMGLTGFVTATWIGSLPYTIAMVLSANYVLKAVR